VIGPMCAVNRVSGEPPSHLACAEFSARACPFLSRPAAERREAGLPDEVSRSVHGLTRNPGVALVWITESYRTIDAGADGGTGTLLRIGPPRGTLWYAEGRPATRAEVLHSIETGLPALEAAARVDGPEALVQLREQTATALRLVPVDVTL